MINNGGWYATSTESPSKSPGYWASDYVNHQVSGFAPRPFKKHSVNEVEEFVGWGKIESISKATNGLRNAALPLALFHTGTRVSEGIQLRRSHFDLSNPSWVKCVDVPIVKQKVSKPFRTFSFPRDEPTWHLVEEYLGSLAPNALLFNLGRTQSYLLVRAMGKIAGLEVWNHWFRSQRASQMGAEYEMTENDLMEWFKVKDRNWARRYCKKGDWGLRKVMKVPEQWRH